jgi:hypothetical protein
MKLGYMDCIGRGGFHVYHLPKPSTSKILRRKGYRCHICHEFWTLKYLKELGAIN